MPEALNLPKSDPLRVGIVGTGYAATKRAEALQQDPRATIIAVAGHSPVKTTAFAQAHATVVSPDWEALVERSDIDMVVVGNVNRSHSSVVRRALKTGKSVVVEYPLALAATEARELIALADQQRSRLHVEHIELLGGLHQAVKKHLPDIGKPQYVRYCTAVPQASAPQKWTYNRGLFGFPLAGALSRLHRLTNLFGTVSQVSCQLQYQGLDPGSGYFKNCRCVALLQFHSGVVAEVLYAKGEHTWRAQRWMEIEGDRGALTFDGNEGTLAAASGTHPITVGGRRGLFARDTAYFLDALYENKPLYVTPQESLYALQVANAAEQSAQTGKTMMVTD